MWTIALTSHGGDSRSIEPKSDERRLIVDRLASGGRSGADAVADRTAGDRRAVGVDHIDHRAEFSVPSRAALAANRSCKPTLPA